MNVELNYIKKNLEEVRRKIEAAAKKSDRKPEDIKIIAVTKTVDTDRIISVLDEGIENLGENRVQELTKKYDIINSECNWHLIGHLQTNKVKYIIDKVRMIHSVDRIELAREIQKRAQDVGRIVDILIQVNVSGEETKFGVSLEWAIDLVKKISLFENIRVKGLMTIAPFAEDQESIRYVFRKLKSLSIDIEKEKIDNIAMDFLSMGMSNDYEAAIEEGANMVRIGTALFGKRQYV